MPERWGRWIDHGPGWYALVVSVDERLAAIDPNYVIHQVKEKYGTLRYYCSPAGDESATQQQATFDSILAEAESASATTCERCGRPGVLRHSANLVKTLCSSCADALGYAG
ncbi:hypothetical protein B1790_06400 [Mycobacterium sp. AT1]|nr:hypothetical protein B1790_06400 [Mycobacterium sp. AT1]